MSVANPTPLQIENFCLALILGKSKAVSFLFAFPESKCGKNAAYSCGGKLFKLLKVQVRLSELKQIANRVALDAAVQDITQRKETLSNEVEHYLPHGSILDEIG